MNNSQLNDFQLNDAHAPVTLTAEDFDILEFEGYSFQTAEVISKDIKVDSTPSRDLVTFNTPRDHGGGFIGDYFRARRVRVSGHVKASTAAALQTTLDTMKRSLSLGEGNLYYKPVGGEVRVIKATWSNPEQIFERREYFNITICPFDVEFLALEPFFHDLDYTSQTNEAVSNLAYNNNIENLGTFQSRAVIVIILTSATAVTGINFENTTNGQAISVNAAFATGDILTIDGEARSVTLNGVEVDYDGIFPNVEYGANNYTITTTGTAVLYTQTIKFKKSYL